MTKPVKTDAGQRLKASLVERFGPIEDGHGRKVYGHKRTAAAWREGVLADLRCAVAVKEITQKPQIQAAAIAPNRLARVAGLAVLIVGAIAAASIEGSQFAIIAAGPLPVLCRCVFGSAL